TLLLAPLAPHMAEEAWARLGGVYSVHLQPWPDHDPRLLVEDEVTLVVQINGRVRARLAAPAGLSQRETGDLAPAPHTLARTPAAAGCPRARPSGQPGGVGLAARSSANPRPSGHQLPWLAR